MHDHDQEPLDANLLEEMGYEPQDVNVHKLSVSIGVFLIATTIIMAVGVLCVWLVIPNSYFKTPQGTTLERRAKPEPPAPLIQSNATAHSDYVSFMKAERKDMTSYEWTDRKNGFVRIPIEDAMKKVMAEGLPSRSAQTGATNVPPMGTVQTEPMTTAAPPPRAARLEGSGR